MLKELIPAYEASLTAVGNALSASFGDTAAWGVAGLREETLVFLLAETMRKLGTVPRYEPCFRDGTRADLSWGHAKYPCMLEAKWWWWSTSLRAVLDDIARKHAFLNHRGDRYALVFSVDDVGCVDHRNTWATPDDAKRWMQDLLERDVQLRKRWTFVGCAAATSPYYGTSWNDERTATRRDGVFVGAFYRMK